MVKGFFILLQLVCVLLIGVELVLHFRMQPTYVGLFELDHDVARHLPNVSDSSGLEGLQGQTDSLVYRWDPVLQGLVFRRRLRPVGGEWGHAIGLVRFDAAGSPTATWHAFPLLLAPLGLMIVVFASCFFWLGKGQPVALSAVPIAVLLAGLFFWMQVFTARGLLDRRALPELAALLESQ